MLVALLTASMADVPKSNNEASVAKQDRVRLTLLVHRKPGLSLSEFQKYRREQHAGVFTGIATVKKNLLNYQQVCGACIMLPQYWALRRLYVVHCLYRLMSMKM